jgi:hypothetical protein
MYLLIDLWDGISEVISAEEAKEYMEEAGVEVTKGDRKVWLGEEQLLVQL